MAKNSIVPYIAQTQKLTFSAGLKVEWVTIATFDKKPKVSAEQIRNDFNKSLEKGGANEHLDNNNFAFNVRVLNQRTNKVIDFYKAPSFQTVN